MCLKVIVIFSVKENYFIDWLSFDFTNTLELLARKKCFQLMTVGMLIRTQAEIQVLS